MTHPRRLFSLLPAVCLGFGLISTAPAGADGTPACKAVVLQDDGAPRTVHGRVRRPSDRFAYCFQGRSGETLQVHFRGPAARLVLVSPNGDANGPGLPEQVKLDQSGRYRLEVSPNLMADGIFGRFALTLRLR